jgi:hypothetical protein
MLHPTQNRKRLAFPRAREGAGSALAPAPHSPCFRVAHRPPRGGPWTTLAPPLRPAPTSCPPRPALPPGGGRAAWTTRGRGPSPFPSTNEVPAVEQMGRGSGGPGRGPAPSFSLAAGVRSRRRRGGAAPYQVSHMANLPQGRGLRPGPHGRGRKGMFRFPGKWRFSSSS